MSKKALELLKIMFAEGSNLQFSVSVVNEVLEIKSWIERELAKEENEVHTDCTDHVE